MHILFLPSTNTTSHPHTQKVGWMGRELGWIVRLRGERVAGRELLQTGLFVWLTGPTTRCFLEVIKVKHFHSAIGVQCPDCQHLVSKILTVLYFHLLYIYNTFKLIVCMQ
ncbi:hypothetical protein Hamer_G027247 [Homarus americanus]|uniref:Uncharacterized protein n=1 Tax=Homarus americanus TaxID=6706 RepID=A0A8J5JLA5_HOMAM|nr:hypothetical protein Hamer_G027247 [Homarus americanus]